jgi:hypothetical protein
MLKTPLILVLILIVLVVVIPTIADELPVINNPPAKQEDGKTTDSKENIKTQKQNSATPLTVANPAPSPPLQESRDNESTQYSKEQKYSWWNFSLTDALLAIFTFALVIVGLFQFCILRGTLKATKVAADAAKDSADALPAIERAYLFVKVTMEKPHDVNIGTDEEPGGNSVNLVITNHGKTPALITEALYNVKPFTNDDKIDKFLAKKIPDRIPSGTVIFDSKEIKEFSIDFPLTHISWKQIMSKQLNLSCLGYICYEDIFGNPHKTIFCWECEPYVGFHPDKDPKRNKRT